MAQNIHFFISFLYFGFALHKFYFTFDSYRHLPVTFVDGAPGEVLAFAEFELDDGSYNASIFKSHDQGFSILLHTCIILLFNSLYSW